MTAALHRWAFPPVPVARVARLRAAVYLVTLLDICFFVTDPIDHGDVPAALYRPLPVRELLHLPQPSPVYTRALFVVIVVSAVVAATGCLPRLAGWVCALAMLDWVSNGMSYGKVDHDHFALVVALFVLPSLGTRSGPEPGRAGWSDLRRSEAAGWAVRMIQLAVVATYFLSAVAKIHGAGWGWASSAILIWALSRRGHVQPAEWLSTQLLLTQVMQWFVLAMEFLSPLLLWLRGRALYAMVGFWVVFHASTYLLLTIHFLPTAICLLAFLPLERLRRRRAPVSPTREPRTASTSPASP